MQFIDVRDLAEWTIRVAEERTTGVFNASGPARPITMDQTGSDRTGYTRAS